MKLYLMRHGETNQNKGKVLQGRMDNPLNAEGKRQAAEAGENLFGISFDACYVSPLMRAVQTAEIVTGWGRDRLIKEKRIIEISLGVLEGKSLKDLGEAEKRFFLDPEHYIAPEGAESLNEMKERVAEFLEDLKKESYENVLAVSHGAAIHALLLVVTGRPLRELWSTDIGNCGVTELVLRDGVWQLEKECEKTDLYYGKGKLQ